MARLQVDDVLLGLKGRTEVATGTESVKIPAYVNDNGRPSTVKLDVSDAGRDELNNLIATVNQKCADIEARVERDKKAAWKPVLDMLEKTGKKPTSRKPKKPAADQGEPQDGQQQHGEGDGSHPGE